MPFPRPAGQEKDLELRRKRDAAKMVSEQRTRWQRIRLLEVRHMKTTNSRPEEYDLVVLGSGEGSKYLAWTLARQGKRVAVVERKYIGGSCPNIACLPSKNIIHSAKVASYFQRSEEFGITKDNVKINMTAVRDRKRKMVDGLVDMHLNNFKTSGAELIMGSGHFIGPRTLQIALHE